MLTIEEIRRLAKLSRFIRSDSFVSLIVVLTEILYIMNYYEYQPKLQFVLSLVIFIMTLGQLKFDQLEKCIFGHYYYAIKAERERFEIEEKINQLREELIAAHRIDLVAFCCLYRDKTNIHFKQLHSMQIRKIQDICNERNILVSMNLLNINNNPSLRI